MPRAIISPSVLASDFGQLSAECKRMIKGGAEWLHMGRPPSRPLRTVHPMAMLILPTVRRRYGRVIAALHAHLSPSLTLPDDSHFVPNITMGTS